MWMKRGVLIAALALGVSALFVYGFPGHSSATTGINQELSFEGKVVTTAGVNIPDGNYNMEFDIYTGCTNEPTSNTGCTSVWTEDYLVGSWGTATSPVTFNSGTFQVNLGQFCALSGSSCLGNSNAGINWNTYPLYLSIDIGNNTAPSSDTSCNGVTNFATNCDGGTSQLMSPFIELTSTPYALNANAVGGVTASSLVQLGATQSGNINIGSGTLTSGEINGQTVSSAAVFTGTVNIQGSTALTLGSGSNNGAEIFTSSGGSNTVTLQAPTTNPGTSYALSLPTTAPTLGQCLENDNTTVGQLTFGTCSTLQSAYTADPGGTTPDIILDSTRDGIDIQDKTGGTIGATQSLLSVRGVGTATTLGASLFTVNANGDVAINNGSTTTTPTISYDLSLGQETTGTRTIGVEAEATTNNNGNGLTISAGAGNGSGDGGTLTLNGGGTAATAGSNGGSVQISGINGTSTGTGGTGGNITLTAGNAGGSAANAGGDITLQAGSATSTGAVGSVIVNSDLNNYGVVTNNDTEIIQDTGASTAALTVQNNLGIPIITAGSNNLLVNGDFESGTTNWGATGTGASIALNSNPTYVYSGTNSLAITVGGTANTGAVDTTFDNTLAAGTYILSFEAEASVASTALEVSLGSGTCTLSSTTVSATVFTAYTYTCTSSTPTEVLIETSTTAAVTLYVDALQLVSNTNLVSNPGFENGTTNWSGGTGVTISQNLNRNNVYYGLASLKVVTGTTASQGATDSTFITTLSNIAATTYDLSFFAEGATAFTTLQATVGGVSCITTGTITMTTTGFTEYSCSAAVPVNTNPTIAITNSGTTSVTFYLDDVQLVTGSTLQAYNIGQIQLRGIIDNPVIFQGTSNSTLAFQIQNAGSTNLFSVDTLDTKVIIGSPTTDTTQVLLQLDSFSTFADTATCSTSTNQGALYYNTSSNSVRGCVNGSWEDLVSGDLLNALLFGVVPDSGSTDPGDLAGVTGLTNGPCKVFVGATTAEVSWNSCEAYSGGRKVYVTAGSNVATTNTTAGDFQHLCLTGAGNQPALSTAGAETANLSTVSMVNTTAPILCLADIKFAAANNTITDVYDTRTFTTSEKDFATAITNAPVLGGIVSIPVGGATPGEVVPSATLQIGGIRGVIVATTGATSTNTVNAIIAVSGPAWVKSITETGNAIGDTIQTTATANYAGNFSGPTTTNVFSVLGLSETAWTGATACAANSNACAGSVLTFITQR